MVERCCGIDVHQGTLVVCLLTGAPGARPRKEIKEFATTTASLRALRDWLLGERCTLVGMESTGVYWMPIFELLEGQFELIVGNAQHIKRVPGRKTDVRDAEWIATLVRHGLVRASFIPAKPFRELRWLTRYRTKLVATRAAESNRVLKLAEAMNLKLASVMSDVFGVSGMLMLRAIADGESDPERLAGLARGTLRRKMPQLALALECMVGEDQRQTLRMQLDRMDRAAADIEALDLRIQGKLVAHEKELALLCTIPGVDLVVAATIIAELGTDLSAFPSEDSLSFWVGLCPGANETAGKRKSCRTPQGNRYLKTALVESAHAASHKKDGFLPEKFRQIRSRGGPGRAAVAVAHKLVIALYHVLTKGEPFKDLGSGHADKVSRQRTSNRLVRRLERLGFKVELTDAAPAEATAPPMAGGAHEPQAPCAPAPAAPAVAAAPPAPVRTYKLRPTRPPAPVAPAPGDAPVADAPCAPESAPHARRSSNRKLAPAQNRGSEAPPAQAACAHAPPATPVCEPPRGAKPGSRGRRAAASAPPDAAPKPSADRPSSKRKIRHR